MSDIKIHDKIVLRDINELLEYERNNKKHPKSQIDFVKNLIKSFGFTTPVLIDKENTIIAGHCRIISGKELGMTKVPTISMEHLSEQQVKALRLADNRSSELSEPDWDNIKFEFEELSDSLFDTDITGYEIDDFKDMLDDDPKEKKEVPKESNVEEVDKLYTHEVECPKCKHRFKKKD